MSLEEGYGAGRSTRPRSASALSSGDFSAALHAADAGDAVASRGKRKLRADSSAA
jgi:hypothetical protein